MLKVMCPRSWVVNPRGTPVYTWVNTKNRATPMTISGVTSGKSISAFDALESRPLQRCRPMAMATPIGVVISMLRTASFTEFFSGCTKVSSCHTDFAGSVKYHRHDGDWNAERLLPELKEMRIATSTGTNDHTTYSHVMVANPKVCRPGRLRLTGLPPAEGGPGQRRSTA